MSITPQRPFHDSRLDGWNCWRHTGKAGTTAETLWHTGKGEIILPFLHAPSGGAETIGNPDPFARHLGVAFFELGRLSIAQY